jgi:hypothetical protein
MMNLPALKGGVLDPTADKKTGLTEKTLEDMYYAFRFRDISKESLMLLAESLIQ